MRIPFLSEIKGDKDERIAPLEECYRLADAFRQQMELDWLDNCDFLAGNQWGESRSLAPRATRKVRTSAPETKVKLTSNQILPLARQAVAAIRENLAEQVAVPATDEPDDVMAADIGTDFLRSRHSEDTEDEVRLHELLWCMVAGRVLRKTYWDPQADYTSVTMQRVQGGGDLVTETLNPFRFHLCPWAEAGKPMPWVIESDVRDVEEVRDLFGNRDVIAEDVSSAFQRSDELLSGMTGGATAKYTPEKRKEACILKRMYASPSRKYPKGKVFTWAGQTFLDESDLPEGEMPFVELDWFPIPGRVYPLPFVTPLRDLQKEINTTLSQLIEVKNRQLRGDVIVRGTGEVRQEILPPEEGGAKRIYIPTSVLDWKLMEYDLRVTDAEMLLSHYHNDMMQASGIHDPTSGKQLPRATTATEIGLLKESDMSGLTLFRAGFDLSYCRVARQKLLIAKNHYQTPRLIRTVGEGQAVKASAFYGADLRNTEDVRPKPTPIVSETMKAQMKAEAVAQGLYGPYLGPDDMLAKLTALASSGIPGAAEEVEKRLGDMTMEDLQKICGRLDALKAEAALIAAEVQIDQLTLVKAQQDMQAEAMMNPQPQVDEMGQPMQPDQGAMMGAQPPEAMMQ